MIACFLIGKMRIESFFSSGTPGPCGALDVSAGLLCDNRLSGVLLGFDAIGCDGPTLYADLSEYEIWIQSGGVAYDDSNDYVGDDPEDDDDDDEDGAASLAAGTVLVASAVLFLLL